MQFQSVAPDEANSDDWPWPHTFSYTSIRHTSLSHYVFPLDTPMLWYLPRRFNRRPEITKSSKNLQQKLTVSRMWHTDIDGLKSTSGFVVVSSCRLEQLYIYCAKLYALFCSSYTLFSWWETQRRYLLKELGCFLFLFLFFCFFAIGSYNILQWPIYQPDEPPTHRCRHAQWSHMIFK